MPLDFPELFVDISLYSDCGSCHHIKGEELADSTLENESGVSMGARGFGSLEQTGILVADKR
jgi:hypothetical protein